MEIFTIVIVVTSFVNIDVMEFLLETLSRSMMKTFKSQSSNGELSTLWNSFDFRSPHYTRNFSRNFSVWYLLWDVRDISRHEVRRWWTKTKEVEVDEKVEWRKAKNISRRNSLTFQSIWSFCEFSVLFMWNIYKLPEWNVFTLTTFEQKQHFVLFFARRVRSERGWKNVKDKKICHKSFFPARMNEARKHKKSFGLCIAHNWKLEILWKWD